MVRSLIVERRSSKDGNNKRLTPHKPKRNGDYDKVEGESLIMMIMMEVILRTESVPNNSR